MEKFSRTLVRTLFEFWETIYWNRLGIYFLRNGSYRWVKSAVQTIMVVNPKPWLEPLLFRQSTKVVHLLKLPFPGSYYQ